MIRFRTPNLPPGWRIKITADPIFKYALYMRGPDARWSERYRQTASTRWGVNRAIRRLEGMAWFQHDQGWKAEIIYPGTTEGELQALRTINERGYGEVRPFRYGE